MVTGTGRLWAALLFVLCPALLGQQTKINHGAITNSSVTASTVDSTPVGSSIQSTGAFTSAIANSVISNNSVQIGNGYAAFQLFPGGTPLRKGITWGADPAGDVDFWINTGEQSPEFFWRRNDLATADILAALDGSGNFFTLGNATISGSATVSGNISAAGFVTSGAANSGSVSTGNITSSGTAAINGNVTAGGFITTGAANVGSINDTGSLGAGTGSFAGNVTAGGFVTSGGVVAKTGNYSGTVTAPTFSGNATSASALANGGGTCQSGGSESAGYSRPITGITAAGAVTCGPLHEWTYTTATCTAGGSSYSTCTVTLGWPLQFSDANYAVVCQGIGATGPQPGAMTVQIGAITAIQVAVVIANQASNAGGSFSALHCMADHF